MVKTVTNEMLSPMLDASEGTKKWVLLRALVPAQRERERENLGLRLRT